MRKNRILCLLLAAVMLISLSGCRGNTSEVNSDVQQNITEQSAGEKTIKLLYSYSDNFNPYTARTELNRNLCSLIFEPLIKLDENYEPVYCLAQSAQIGDKSCTVVLRDATFSDGSRVTADDVVYSYKAAKNSATLYAHQLYEVLSATATNQNTVVFNLTQYDSYFINLLDFPIIKSESDKITDADGVAQPPIGCGRYTVSGDKKSLIINDGYFGNKGVIKSIELINTPDGEAVSHHVEIGAADIYYTDLSDGNIVRMSGKKTEVGLNSMVYIGINSSYGDLAGNYMRYAISSALDRSAICNQAYYNNAVAATGFFNPAFKDASARQTIESKSNLEITVENLSKIGYNSMDNDGYAVNNSGKHPSYTLLVNKENASRVAAAKLIASQLKAAGIGITVIERSYAEYVSALQSGSFQLYLGEIQILNNMDLSPLVKSGGAAAYGISTKEKENVATEGEHENEQQTVPQPQAVSYESMLSSFYSGDAAIGIGDIAGALLTEMPQIPVCYRLGLLFYDSDIEDGVKATVSDIYYSIESYKYK